MKNAITKTLAILCAIYCMMFIITVDSLTIAGITLGSVIMLLCVGYLLMYSIANPA